MRLHILRTLFLKEVRRHVANRGGIALALLLVVASMLLSFFNPGSGAGGSGGGPLIGGVHTVLVQYGEEGPFINHLKKSRPEELKAHIFFDNVALRQVDGLLTYPPGTGALQIRTVREGNQVIRKLSVWHPPGDPGALAPFEAWFWKACREASQQEAALRLKEAKIDPNLLTTPVNSGDDLWPIRDSFHQLEEQTKKLLEPVNATRKPEDVIHLPRVEMKREGLGAETLDIRSAVATAMVVFSLYLTCVYLLPTMNCEERERGTLLAQALSPASPAEILTAKFLFYPMLGIMLAATLTGIYRVDILKTLFFWLALVAMAAGFLGIGMTISTLAKTQRAAFMGSMCYLVSVALLLFICQQNVIPYLPYLALEFHGPRILHAAITQGVQTQHWVHLGFAAFLALIWLLVAGRLFRTRGWQ